MSIYYLMNSFHNISSWLWQTNLKKNPPIILILLFTGKCLIFKFDIAGKQMKVNIFSSFLKYRKVVDEQRRGRNRSDYRFERCLVKMVNSGQTGSSQERKMVENLWLYNMLRKNSYGCLCWLILKFIWFFFGCLFRNL